jgi:hypothetical protein
MSAAQQCVHPTGGSLRVFEQFAWLEVGSVKMALSHPAHQRVTRAVNWNKMCNKETVATMVTGLTRETGTRCVTPSGMRARRCRDEDEDCIA